MLEMEMAPERYQKSFCGVTTIKQEPAETDPLASPKREFDTVFVKDETPFLHEWEVPDGVNSPQDPLCIKNEEFSPSEDDPGPSTFNIDKTEDEEDEEESRSNGPSTFNIEKTEDEEDEEESRSNDGGEECSLSEDQLGPSMFNIEKTEEEEEDEEEAVTDNDGEEFNCNVESTSSGSKPESTASIGAKNDSATDDRDSLGTKVYVTAGIGNATQCTTKQEASRENKGVPKHLVHRGVMCKMMCEQWQGLVDVIYNDSRDVLHSCSLCHKTFSSSGGLKIHFSLHTGEPPYYCGVCKKTFMLSSSLRLHMRTHSGERPYSCGVCDKKFTQSGSLKRHSQLHTGERPYGCGVCNKTFTESSSLKKHLRVHSGERPYSCGLCTKTFKHKSSLNQHSLLHTGGPTT